MSEFKVGDLVRCIPPKKGRREEYIHTNSKAVCEVISIHGERFGTMGVRVVESPDKDAPRIAFTVLCEHFLLENPNLENK